MIIRRGIWVGEKKHGDLEEIKTESNWSAG